MQRILITSTEAYSGKSGICLALLSMLSARGRSVAYFKPYGTMPMSIDGVMTDKDAYYMNQQVTPPAPPIEAVCPVLKTRAFVEGVMRGTTDDVRSRVVAAFEQVAQGRDVVVMEGPVDVFQGTAVGLSICELADLLQARVLVVTRPSGVEFPDELLGACGCLGDRLAGALFNWVHPSNADFVRDHVTPFLRRRNIPVFGALPQDSSLASVSVHEIVDALQATVLSAENRLEEPVEAFMVGAMGQEKALRFFRRKGRKAVITGGDRADVQLAALETDTRALILTGNLPPSSLVLARADEIGVPMLLVDMDTLTAVERLDSLMGRTRIHDPGKAAKIRESLETNADVPGLLKAFGID